MVTEYFERVTDTYREKWSESFHFAVFTGSEPLEEAIQTTERNQRFCSCYNSSLSTGDLIC